ncbi:MAG: GNAT family N-acetyltransferase [Anaerolineales bacterium]
MTAGNSPKILVRPEQNAQLDAIHAVQRAAFGRDTEADLIRNLRQTPQFNPRLSLMALYNGAVVGHGLFYPVKLEAHDDVLAYGLGPIGVAPDYWGQFIGSALIYEGLEVCRRQKIDLVFVLGNPEYYTRFGFSLARDYGLHTPYDPDGHHFMVQAITRGVLDDIGGAVVYHSAFDEA